VTGFITHMILLMFTSSLHRSDMKKNLSACSGSVIRVQKVLLLLVESGVAYCVLWVSLCAEYYDLILMGIQIFFTASAFMNGSEKQSSSFEVFGSAMPLLSVSLENEVSS
jgi:hypothetical protein